MALRDIFFLNLPPPPLPQQVLGVGPSLPGERGKPEAAAASHWAAFALGVGGTECSPGQALPVGVCFQRSKAPMTLSTCQVLHFHLLGLTFPSNFLLIPHKHVLVEIPVGKVEQFGVEDKLHLFPDAFPRKS